MRLALACLAVAALGGCFPDKQFNCGISDSHCNPGERCIFNHCAARDASCPSAGYRYTATAGPLAMACVSLLPDGGLPCAQAGDPCDDGDPCTDNDVCVDAMTCKGTAKDCGPNQCANGMLTKSVCTNGTCMSTSQACDPYACADATKCASSCQTFADCDTGYYCASNMCLSCGDVLTNVNYVPEFSPLQQIPGVDLSNIDDEAPFLSDDRKTLWFASNRGGGVGKLDVWQATRAKADLSTPFGAPIDLNINSAFDDTDPFTLDGMSVYFASDRNKMDYDLLVGGNILVAPPTGTGSGNQGFNTPSRDAHPALTGDTLRLYFDSDRNSSTMVGERTDQLWFAARQSAAQSFGAVTPVPGLPMAQTGPLLSLYSPTPTRKAEAIYAVSGGIPSRPNVVFAHLDASGTVTSPPTVLLGSSLGPANPSTSVAGAPGAWSSVSVTGDGCFMVATSRSTDAAGDAMWAYRTGSSFCNSAGCGSADGCCPATNCSGLYDPDCPYPRTQLVLEYFSPNDQNYWYGLVGETPPTDSAGKPYVATSKGFRLLQDQASGADPIYRLSTMSCDGKLYTWVGTSTRASDPLKFTNERTLGYAFVSSLIQQVTPINRTVRENVGVACDSQLSFTKCASPQPQGYSCGTLENVVQP